MSEAIQKIAEAASDAFGRIADFVCETPLERSDVFSEALEAEVFFKLENRQHTGSFKLRGATNRLMTLPEAQRSRGCVAASRTWFRAFE